MGSVFAKVAKIYFKIAFGFASRFYVNSFDCLIACRTILSMDIFGKIED